jgi:hypothetical protein
LPIVGTSAFASASDVFDLVRGLVNDRDVPLILTIPQTGAVRAGNIVTITTNQPHGLQVNSIVQIGFVSDPSFNGTQTVFSVPSSTVFTYQQAGANTTSGNGTVSDIVQGDWAIDAVLLPFANKAYRKVQRRLNQGGSKTMTNDIVIEPPLPAGATQLSDSSFPQLPPDFLAPRQLFERIAGQPYFGPQMRQLDALPSRPQGALNFEFSWFDETLNFVGALNATELRLRYFSGFPRLSDGTSQILIRDAEDCVADYTAYLASESRNRGSGQGFLLMFEQDMQELKNAQVHARQYRPGRRRPNNSRRGWGSGCNWGGNTV